MRNFIAGLLVACGTSCPAALTLDGPTASAFGRSIAAGLTIPAFVRAASNSSITASSLTISSFDCSGGNYLIVVEAEKAAVPRGVTSVTCNGVALTLVSSIIYNVSSGHLRMYRLAAPTTGDVVFTLNGSTTGFTVSALLFSGVGGVGTAATDASNTVRFGVTNSLTTVTTDLVVDCLSYAGNLVQSYTPGSGQTSISTVLPSAIGAHQATTKNGAASATTMSWVVGGVGDAISWIGLPLNGQ